MVGDGFCNTECFVRQCDYDGGDCEFDPSTYCSPKCKKSMLRDGHCDPECLTFMCRYDRGDCESCVIGCPKVWLDDGIC